MPASRAPWWQRRAACPDGRNRQQNLRDLFSGVGNEVFKPKESQKHATTVAVDLVKSNFQIAVAEER